MKLSGQTEQTVNAIKMQQRNLREKLELVLLRDLIEKLDPEHDYTFDAEKMEFTKTLKKKPEELSPPLGPVGLQ